MIGILRAVKIGNSIVAQTDVTLSERTTAVAVPDTLAANVADAVFQTGPRPGIFSVFEGNSRLFRLA